MRRLLAASLVVGFAIALPSVSSAQATIAGVVNGAISIPILVVATLASEDQIQHFFGMEIEAGLIPGFKRSQHLLRGFVKQACVRLQPAQEPDFLRRPVKRKQEMPYMLETPGREAPRKGNLIGGIGAGAEFPARGGAGANRTTGDW